MNPGLGENPRPGFFYMRFISYRTRDIEKMYKGSMNSATTPQLFIPFVDKK